MGDGRHEHDLAAGRWFTGASATLRWLPGCGLGGSLGMVIATALPFGNTASIAILVALAFVFGYGLTMRPLLAAVGARGAIRLALASATLSIATMEIVDNAFILAVPGALAAGLADGLFWWSL